MHKYTNYRSCFRGFAAIWVQKTFFACKTMEVNAVKGVRGFPLFKANLAETRQ